MNPKEKSHHRSDLKTLIMNSKIFFVAALFTLVMINANAQTAQQYYELKTYTFNTDEQLKTTENFLENAYLPALKEIGIGPVGVFKPVKISDSLQQLYVLLPFDSLEEFTSLQDKLSGLSSFRESGKNYLNAKADNAPYARISSTLLKAFEDMPVMQPSQVTGPRENRIYELRSYQSPTEDYFARKVKMFNAGGEIKLFDALGFNAVFYSEAIIGPEMPNLVYMVTFENEAERDAHWQAFGSSPVWKKLSAEAEYQDTVNHITSTYLYPTSYSAY